MANTKRRQLVDRLARQGPATEWGLVNPTATIEEFFDGNLDPSSFVFAGTGAQLSEFKDALLQLRRRSGVLDVLIGVSYISEDENNWPQANQIYVFSTLSGEDIESALEEFGASAVIESGNDREGWDWQKQRLPGQPEAPAHAKVHCVFFND